MVAAADKNTDENTKQVWADEETTMFLELGHETCEVFLWVSFLFI